MTQIPLPTRPATVAPRQGSPVTSAAAVQPPPQAFPAARRALHPVAASKTATALSTLSNSGRTRGGPTRRAAPPAARE